MGRTLLVVLFLLLAIDRPAPAGERTPLGKSLNDIETADHWIYDDWPAAVAEAKKTGKPILAVIRCVPCPPGKDLDLKVMQPNKDLAELEQQFVCVRIIQTNRLDQKIFQYDYDMSWSCMFLNANGTVYGRYGSRSASGPGSDSILNAGAFSKAARRALELHKGYPANAKQLAAKTGPDPEYAVPTQIPGLTEKPASASVRQECIHCHMVKEFALRAKWEEGRLKAEDLFVYPMPQRIGLTMSQEDDLKVQRVEEGSAADEAGIEAGDTLVSLGGQPLVSMADIQWVLTHTPGEAKLPVKFTRGGQTEESKLELSGDWKKSDIAWRASSWYALRQGVKFEPLPAADRKARGIGEDELALVVKGLFGKGGPKVQQAGLRQNDVLVAVDGKTQAMTESEFLVDLRLQHGPKDSVKFTVLRGDQRRDFDVPLW
ncbi:MAG TPA: Trx7/PDZ domain-containing (seleno)protein [Pirellulaceae bacterium]|nr:Trx7/PDZ domain-containing (seleno)protein [Pirellulaceae bacterium]